MKYRQFGNTGMEVSALSFGAMRLPMEDRDGEHVLLKDQAMQVVHRAFELGVNYIDTAHGYCRGASQPFLGEALEGWRDKVHLSTKSPTWLLAETGDYRRYLDEQLELLRTDCLDIYYFHGLSWKRYAEKVRPLKLLDEALKARDEGLVRHLGFSTHDSAENVRRLIDEGWAEAMLCQYNLLDRRHEPTLAYARSKGLGTAVMGPVGGGRLGVDSPKLRALAPDGVKTTPELAIRFVLANPDVCCALSGMGTVEMVEENTAVASRDDALTADELERINEAVAQIRKLADLYCTGCNYCMPCPEGVNIPRNFELLNYERVYGLGDYARDAYAKMKPATRADACIECGQCEEKCPQNIEIRKQLKEVAQVLGCLPSRR